MELKEITSFEKLRVIHEGQTKDGQTMTIKARIADTKRNVNNRSYPASLLKREVARLQKQIESGGFFGTAEHPAGGNQTITNASHIFKKMWFEPVAKEVWAEMKIIPTVKGKDLMALIKNGAQLGLSTRGTGSVSSEGKVMDDYKMLGVDIVGSPSSQGAKFDKDSIFESVGFESNPKLEDWQIEKNVLHKIGLIKAHHKQSFDEAGETKKEGDGMKKKSDEETKEEFIQDNLKMQYGAAKREEGFKGSFEEWKCTDKNEVVVRAACAYNAGEFSSMEQALTALGAPEIAEKHTIEMNEVDPQKYAWEARECGLSPIEYAKRMNANIGGAIKSVAIESDDEHRATIIAEASAAGMDISTPEKRLEILEKMKQVVIEETDEGTLLEAEAVKIHKELNESGEEVSLNTVRAGLLKEQEKREEEKLKQARISSMVRETMLAGGIIRRKEEK